MKRYWFLTLGIKEENLLDITIQTRNAVCDRHPAEVVGEMEKSGLKVAILFMTEISRDDYDKFIDTMENDKDEPQSR